MKKKTVTSAGIVATVAIMMIGLFLAIAVSGTLVSSKTVQNSGIVASSSLGIYSDNACTQGLTSINWGTISPSSSITRTVYVKNAGNTPLTLSLANANWNPASANGPITVTWDQENSVLNVDQVVAATLTLSLSSNTNGITTFSFNVVISGTG